MADVPPELAAEVQKLERYHAENPQGRYFVPLANAYRKMGALDQAEALLREGLRRHPDYLSAHIVLGRCLADRGATADAVGEFRYVLSVDPQNLIALRSLGEIASEGGRTDEAARWYRELLAVDPMNDDARRALEALEAHAAGAVPAAAAPEEEASWSAGAEPAGEDEGADDETLAWGAVELDAAAGDDAPPGEAPPPDPFGSLDFGDLEPADAHSGPPSAGAEPEEEPAGAGAEGSAGWDPYSGSTLELETPPPGGGDEAGAAAAPEPGGDAEEVVTETIAELYARQGFHDRAADVYRELIRRRGGDPALEARLREVERLAAGEPPPASELGLHAPDAFEAAGPATTTDDIPLLEWSVGEAETGAAPEPEPFPAAAGEDAFAGSFEAGFGGVELPAASEADEVAAIFAREEAFFVAAPGEPEPAEEPADEEEPLVVAAGASELLAGEPAPEGLAEAEPFAGGEAGETVEAPAAGFTTVRDYLAGMAAWQPAATAAPGGAVAPAEVAPTTVDEAPAEAGPVAEAFHEAAAEDEEDDMPWLASPVSGGEERGGGAEPVEIDGLLEAESAGAAASAGAGEGDDEPFPWELAPAGDEVAPPAPPAEEPAVPAAPGFSFEEFFVEPAEPPAPPAPEQAAPEPPRAEAPPAQPAEPPSGGGEEDEDLESFQAWLQSLKR